MFGLAIAGKDCYHAAMLYLLCLLISPARADLPFRPVHESRLEFKQVSFPNRIKKDVFLKEWIQVGEHQTIGIDDSGRVLSVTEVDRFLQAQPLSGFRSFHHIYLSRGGSLFALGIAGRVYRFSLEAFLSQPARSYVVAWLTNSVMWGAASIVLSSVPDFLEGHLFNLGTLEMVGTYWAIGTTILGAGSLHQFWHDRKSPDGFIGTNEHWPDARIVDFESDRDGFHDYLLKSEGRQFKLSERLQDLHDRNFLDCSGQLEAY